MKNKKLIFLLILGSIIGTVFAFISLYQHVELVNELKVSKSFCNLSASFNCDKVNDSKYAEFLGVPIASYGIFYYLIILGWIIYYLRSKKIKDEVFSNACLVFTTGSIVYSIYLFCVSEFIIKTLCLNCIAMYIANFMQWLASLWLDRKTQFIKRMKNGILSLISFPFIALWTSGYDEHPLRKQASVACVAGVLLGAFLIFLPNNILLPHIRGEYIKSQRKQENFTMHNKGFYAWLNEPVQEIALNATKDLDGVYFEGNKNAPIKIVEYADLQCPACRMYYNSSKNFLKKYSDKILFVYKHFPLDGQCNSMIKKDYHKYACFASLFSLCAGEQGKYWESMDEIYTMSALSEDKGDLQVKKEFEEIIDDLGLDKIAFNECLESRRYINKIITDIEEAKSLNIPGTPFVFINGKQLKNRNEIIMEEIFNYILSNN